MIFYFILQFRRIQRALLETGIRPVFGFPLILAAFIALSVYLFYKTEFARWIYTAIAASVLLRLGESGRVDSLKSLFPRRQYFAVRLLENSLAALPFLCFLLFKQQYPAAAALGVGSVLLAGVRFRQLSGFAIPTPFRKFPFEFPTGFRKSAWLFALAFFLLFKAIQVGNPNLGLVALALSFLVCMSFYIKPEDVFFVWIFAANSRVFLRKKIVGALICSSLLSFPVFAALAIAFTDHFAALLGIQFAGYVFLVTVVLAKYSAYPREMSLPQALFLGMSLWFPPFLFVVIPLFYKQSVKQLQPFLG